MGSRGWSAGGGPPALPDRRQTQVWRLWPTCPEAGHLAVSSLPGLPQRPNRSAGGGPWTLGGRTHTAVLSVPRHCRRSGPRGAVRGHGDRVLVPAETPPDGARPVVWRAVGPRRDSGGRTGTLMGLSGLGHLRPRQPAGLLAGVEAPPNLFLAMTWTQGCSEWDQRAWAQVRAPRDPGPGRGGKWLPGNSGTGRDSPELAGASRGGPVKDQMLPRMT